jgi:hypothetical protein
MQDSSLSRWMWLIGLVAVVAIFFGFGPLSNGSPSENASGATVVHWYNAHTAQQWASVYLVGLGLALLLVFVTQLRSVLVATGGQRLWPNVAFASAILLIAGIIVAGSFEIILILAAHNDQFSTAKLVNFFNQNDELLFLVGLCFLTLATGLAILLNREVAPLPKLLGWYSLLVGVVAVLGPLSFFSLLFGLPIWMLAVGIVVAVKSRRGELGPSTDGGQAAVGSSAATPVPA